MTYHRDQQLCSSQNHWRPAFFALDTDSPLGRGSFGGAGTGTAAGAGAAAGAAAAAAGGGVTAADEISKIDISHTCRGSSLLLLLLREFRELLRRRRLRRSFFRFL